MLKKLLFVGVLFCLFFSCQEEDVYQIKVNLSNLEAQNIYAVFEASDSKLVDTLSYQGSGEFVVTRAQDNFRTLTLYFEDKEQWITLYLESQKRISVTGDALYPQLVKVKGGKINELLSEFRRKASSLLKEQADYLAANSESQKNITKKASNPSRMANVSHELRVEAERFIKKHPNEKVSVILIKEYFSDADDPLLIDNLLDSLDPELHDFYVVKELKAFAEKAKRTIIGAKAPDFNVHNINGTPFNIDSFVNQYFILAFTAKWCDKCQTGELLLNEIVSFFPEDTLSVMLVSLDENPQEVRNLIKNDSIRWNIVTDSAGQAIELIDLYNVSALPRCFLMDRKGYIILKTENGSELKQMLEHLIPKIKN